MEKEEEEDVIDQEELSKDIVSKFFLLDAEYQQRVIDEIKKKRSRLSLITPKRGDLGFRIQKTISYREAEAMILQDPSTAGRTFEKVLSWNIAELMPKDQFPMLDYIKANLDAQLDKDNFEAFLKVEKSHSLPKRFSDIADMKSFSEYYGKAPLDYGILPPAGTRNAGPDIVFWTSKGVVWFFGLKTSASDYDSSVKAAGKVSHIDFESNYVSTDVTRLGNERMTMEPTKMREDVLRFTAENNVNMIVRVHIAIPYETKSKGKRSPDYVQVERTHVRCRKRTIKYEAFSKQYDLLEMVINITEREIEQTGLLEPTIMDMVMTKFV